MVINNRPGQTPQAPAQYLQSCQLPNQIFRDNHDFHSIIFRNATVDSYCHNYFQRCFNVNDRKYICFYAYQTAETKIRIDWHTEGK